MIVNGTFKKGGTLKRTFLNPILHTRHSWNAVPVQNKCCCGAVDFWSTYANLQTHVHRYIVYTQTGKLYNITPLGVSKPKKPPQEHWSHGSESFNSLNGFNLYIMLNLVITYNAQYTIGLGPFASIWASCCCLCFRWRG